MSIAAFLKKLEGRPSVLFIRERGCKYCEAAALELEKLVLPSEITREEIWIEQAPTIVSELALVGVPAFLFVRPDGQRRVQVGWSGAEVFLRNLGWLSE